MVVDQVDIARRVRLFVVRKNQAPISCDGEAPESLQVALGGCSFRSKSVSGFEREQQLTRLVRHRGLHALGVVIRVEMQKAFVPKAYKLNCVFS